MIKKNFNAALIIIGNEILSGRTKDLNLQYIANKLNERGIKLIETRVVPDCEEDIIFSVNSLRNKVDYLFTTGGIGPTHDDITSVSIAKAFGVLCLDFQIFGRRIKKDFFYFWELSH